MVKGTQVGTITDIDGKYFIQNIPTGAKELEITYVGMLPQTVQIKSGEQKVILKSDNKQLDEVVITGYGVTKKAAFTGAASTVGTEKIVNKTDANPIKALEGTVPGVQMNIGSGQPGAPATIFIRGRNSINSGTQPLYIVDGVPYNADAVGVRSDEGQDTSPLSNLNANDIESMTVLKDATATSIYGARAANGVIVITTKKGKGGATCVNFSAKLGMQMMPAYKHFNYSPCDADKYLELWREACANEYKTWGEDSTVGYYMDMLGLPFNNEGYDEFISWGIDNTSPVGTNTNWLNEVTRTGLTQEYAVDVQGGSTDPKGAKFYLSASYLGDEGIVIGKDLKRYSFRLNMEQAPSKVVKYGMNTNFAYTMTNMGAGGGYFSDPITQAYMMSPINSVKNEDGSWNFDTVNGYNPVAQRSKLGDQSLAKQYRIIVSPFLQINFTPDLYFMSRGAADIYLVDEFGYWSFLQPQGEDMNGMGENNNTTRSLLSISNTLNYIKTFNEKHDLNILFGQEAQHTYLKQAYLSASNYPVDYLPQVTNAAVPGSASTSIDRIALASFFGNAEYSYDNKYYVSGSFRVDGSSRFGSNNRWAPFWSAGLKYRISEESFMEGAKNYIDNMTLRMSYGTSGNSEVGGSYYASRNLFGFGYNYNGVPGMAHEQSGNPDLKWEKTNKFNVGLDIAFLKRFNLEFDYYNHRTTDMVFAVPVSMTTGLAYYYKNVGELKNAGIEASLSSTIINNKDWRWNVTITGSHNKNEVVKLSTDSPIEGSVQITEVGRPLYQFKMKEYAGVDPETGDPLWYLNESGDETTSDYNKATKRYLGSANPTFQGSLTSTLNYRDFDFSFQLNTSLGGKIYGSNLRYDEQVGGSFGENFIEYVYNNRWQNPGDITDVPRLEAFYSGSAQSNSSRFLMNGNYLKIRSLTLGYTLPNNLIEKMHMSKLRFYVQADNIYTFGSKKYRGFDPSSIDADGIQWWNYPTPRNIVFGVNVGF
jgi:TonB-linked SusC/RagA family outer membrane protein